MKAMRNRYYAAFKVKVAAETIKGQRTIDETASVIVSIKVMQI